MFFMKQIINDDKKKSFLIALTAFTISFIIQIFYNSYVIIFRSLPDEMGAVYLASTLSGNDWSYIMTHPAFYYGSLGAPLMYPFFCLIDDPLILYQCLLGIGAFLRSVPAIICFYISNKYLHITNRWILLFLSIASCFFTPTRATNIDNEPNLILCCWLLILLIMELANISNTLQQKKKMCFSILLSMISCISLLAHTRAIIYLITIVIIICIYHYLTGESLVHYKSFLGSFCIFYVMNRSIISYWTRNLYPVENDAMLSNTSNSLITGIKNALTKLSGKYGIQSFFDLLTSNLLIIFVFSGGIIIFSLCLFVFHLFISVKYRLKKNYIEKTSLLFPLMFCIIGGGIGIIGVCITWIDASLNQHLNGGNLTRGHFYLRYYSNFFSPLFMILVGYIFNKDISIKNIATKVKEIFVSSMILLEICAGYSLYSFINTVSIKYQQEESDWFHYFAPLSFSFTQWPNVIQSKQYYLTAIIVSCLLFVIFFLYYKLKKYLIMILCILLFLLYQYGYSVIYWDKPFCYSENYYQSVDGIYEFKKEHSALFEKIDKICYLNPKYGPQYEIQYILKEIPITLEFSPNEENTIILSPSVENVLNEGIASNKYWYISLDDNECLIVKGELYLSMFADADINLIPLTKHINN